VAGKRKSKETLGGGLPLQVQIQRDREYLEKIQLQTNETRAAIWLDYMTDGEKSVVNERLEDLSNSAKELMKTFDVIAGRKI
jgi:hypothetical protein